jgi:hypothetical protein
MRLHLAHPPNNFRRIRVIGIHIQDQEIVRALLDETPGLIIVGGYIDDVILGIQPLAQKRAERTIAFGNEDTHNRSV